MLSWHSDGEVLGLTFVGECDEDESQEQFPHRLHE